MRLALVGASFAILAVLAAAGGSLVAPPALAEPVPSGAIELNVYAPAGCPKNAALRTELEARLGDVVLAPARVVVTIEADTGEPRSSLEIQIIDADGSIAEPRRLSGANCHELVSAAALILSIALVRADELAVTKKQPSAREPRLDFEEPTDPATSAVREVRLKREPSQPVRGHIGAVSAIDSGTLPSVAPSIGVVAGLSSGPLRVEAATVYFPSRRVVADRERNSGGDLSAVTATARACIRASKPISLCGGGEWSFVTASAFGTDITRTETSYLWGLTGGARWQLRIGERVTIAATAELVARPQRPEFRLSNPVVVVHRPSWLSARFWLHGEVAVF